MPSLPSPPSISFFSSCPSSLEMPFLSCQSLTPFCHGQHSWDTNNKKRAQITTKKGENGIRERLQRNNWSTKEYQEWKEGDCGWIDYLVCKPSAMKRDWLSCSALSSSLSSCSEGKSSVDTRGVSTLRSQRHVRWREIREETGRQDESFLSVEFLFFSLKDLLLEVLLLVVKDFLLSDDRKGGGGAWRVSSSTTSTFPTSSVSPAILSLVYLQEESVTFFPIWMTVWSIHDYHELLPRPSISSNNTENNNINCQIIVSFIFFQHWPLNGRLRLFLPKQLFQLIIEWFS